MLLLILPTLLAIGILAFNAEKIAKFTDNYKKRKAQQARDKASRKEEELFAGVEKPTVTLAKMMVSEMIQNLKADMVECGGPDGRPQYWDGPAYTIFYFPTFELKVYRDRFGSIANSVRIAVEGVTLCDVSRKIIADGFSEFLSLRARQDKIDEENRIQQEAIDFIAKRMGVKG